MTITTQIELGLLLDVEAECEGYVPARRNGSGEPGPAGWDAPDGGWIEKVKLVLAPEDAEKIRNLVSHADLHIREQGRPERLVADILNIITDGGFSTEAEERLSEEIPS